MDFNSKKNSKLSSDNKIINFNSQIIDGFYYKHEQSLQNVTFSILHS